MESFAVKAETVIAVPAPKIVSAPHHISMVVVSRKHLRGSASFAELLSHNQDYD